LLYPQKRLNLTKTVHKTPIGADLHKLGAITDDSITKRDPKYDEEGMFVSIVCLISCINDEQLSQPTITFVG
jgi:hypothetical protein